MADLAILDESTAATMLQAAIGQLEFAREYTLELLDATPKERWFEIPDGMTTHIAWQVGHLGVSQYGLLMFRIRGRDPGDLEIVPGAFRKKYSRQTVPNADPAGQMTPDELLERLATIKTQAMSVLASVDAATLLEPVDMPYAHWPNKLGAILFCPMHEQIHAGQIGLVRRGLGLDSVR